MLSLSLTIIYSYVFMSIMLFHLDLALESIYVLIDIIFISQTIIGLILFWLNFYKYISPKMFEFWNKHCKCMCRFADNENWKQELKKAQEIDSGLKCLRLFLNVMLLSIGVLSVSVSLYLSKTGNDQDYETRSTAFNIFFVFYRLLMLGTCSLVFILIYIRHRYQLKHK